MHKDIGRLNAINTNCDAIATLTADTTMVRAEFSFPLWSCAIDQDDANKIFARCLPKTSRQRQQFDRLRADFAVLFQDGDQYVRNPYRIQCPLCGEPQKLEYVSVHVSASLVSFFGLISLFFTQSPKF